MSWLSATLLRLLREKTGSFIHNCTKWTLTLYKYLLHLRSLESPICNHHSCLYLELVLRVFLMFHITCMSNLVANPFSTSSQIFGKAKAVTLPLPYGATTLRNDWFASLQRYAALPKIQIYLDQLNDQNTIFYKNRLSNLQGSALFV